jgi:hypothetical protein
MPDLTAIGDVLDAILTYLDDHQGALMLLSTIVYAALTIAVLWDSRDARLSAAVVARPMLWPHNESVMAVYLENLGPSVAMKIELDFVWRAPDGSALGEPIAIRLPAMAPGDRKPYMPDMVLERDEEGELGLPTVADRGLTLMVDWSWQDGRRRFFRHRRHSASLEIDMAAFRDSVHGVPNVIEPDPVDRIIEAARGMVRDQDRKTWLNDPTGMPPDIKVSIEADQLRERWAIWKARFRYWVIGRGKGA